MNLNLSTDFIVPPPPRAFILEYALGLWLLQHPRRVYVGAASILLLFASVFMLFAALYAHIIPAVLFDSANAQNK